MNMKYPEIDLKQLEAILHIVEQASSDDKYFTPVLCPYDEATVRMIKQTIEACQLNVVHNEVSEAGEKPKRGRPRKTAIEDVDEVEKELDDLRKELAQLRIDQKAMAVADQIQIFKVRASIIERMIGMKERVVNMKQQMNFISLVIQIMNDHLNQEQREAVMKLLKPYAEKE